MKEVREVKEVVPADLMVCNGAASFLQSGFWGSFKARFGWSARGFLVDWAAGGRTSLLVLRRRLAPGVSFAYVPWGPELPGPLSGVGAVRGGRILAELAEALRQFLPGDTAFIRFDPPWYTEGGETTSGVLFPPLPGLTRAGADIQPPDTVLIDLAPPLEAILGQMKSKWRYNIGLAAKRGVEVRRAGAEELAVFYALFRETARRDGIAAHSLDYYRTLFAHSGEYTGDAQDLRLYLAEHRGAPLAALILLIRGPWATYLYGASSDRERNLMAPHALQWAAMQAAKAAGCLTYDLFGIPPNEDPLHPMAGLYRFKTGFGGRIIHRPGSWDFCCHPLRTRLFQLAESLRKDLRTLKKILVSLSKKSKARDVSSVPPIPAAPKAAAKEKLALLLFLFLFLFPLSSPLGAQDAVSNVNAIAKTPVDPLSLIGLSLGTALTRFGPPQEVYAARGLEPWQDDVVFVYAEWDLFVYKDRVWQVGVKAALGVSLGDSREEVALRLGEVAGEEGEEGEEGKKYRLYPLPAGAWPVELRVNFNDAGRVTALYLYRSDF